MFIHTVCVSPAACMFLPDDILLNSCAMLEYSLRQYTQDIEELFGIRYKSTSVPLARLPTFNQRLFKSRKHVST